MVKDIPSLLGNLEKDYRIPFLMNYQGYGYQEIALQMNISVSTVEVRLQTARQHLKDLLSTNSYSNLPDETISD